MADKKILYLDMDDTLADFIGSEELLVVGTTATNCPRKPMEMYNKGFFRNLKPIQGAKEAVAKIIQSGLYEVYILSVPVFDSPQSYSEKAEWIAEHYPELAKKMVLTQEKELCIGHYLIDDNLDWEAKWCKNTGGTFIHFDPRKNRSEQWKKIADRLTEPAK